MVMMKSEFHCLAGRRCSRAESPICGLLLVAKSSLARSAQNPAVEIGVDIPGRVRAV